MSALTKKRFAEEVPGFLAAPLNKSTRRLFVAATRMNDGKTTVSLGLFGALRSMGLNVGYIKPVAQRIVEMEGEQVDEDSRLLNLIYDVKLPVAAMSPVAIDPTFTRRYLDTPEELRPQVIDRICRAFDRAAFQRDIVIIEGSGHAGVGSVFDCSNASNARLLGAKVLLVASGGIGKPIDEPHIASVQIVPKEGVDIKMVEAGAIEILDDWLANIPKLQQMLFRGELSTY